MSAPCEVCTRPAGEGFAICESCGNALADDLADVAGLRTGRDGEPLPSLPDELLTAISRQDHLTVRSDRRGREEGLPWKQTPAQAARALHGALAMWARQLADTRRDTLDATTTAEVAAWLHNRVDWLRQHPAAAQAHADLTAAVANARDAIDLPSCRARFPVGPCPDNNDDGPCPGTVWAYIATGNDESLMRCRCCGARWNTTQWYRVGKRIQTRRRQLERNAAA